MKNYLKIIFPILLFSFLIPLFTKAITFESPLKAKSFEELIDAIINFIFWVAMAIVPIMIIVAAFYFLTSGGNPEKVNTAKKIILYTFIGLFIVLSGKGIVSMISQILKGGPIGPPPLELTPALLSQMGDLNSDCKIDSFDLPIVAHAFGSKPGDPNWNPNVDFKQDNIIDNYDVEIFKFNYNLDVKCGDLITPALLSQMGDLNSDCKIDSFDLAIVGKAFGSKPGDPNWNPNVDFKQDNVIDNYDVEIFKFNYELDVEC